MSSDIVFSVGNVSVQSYFVLASASKIFAHASSYTMSRSKTYLGGKCFKKAEELGPGPFSSLDCNSLNSRSPAELPRGMCVTQDGWKLFMLCRLHGN